MNGPQPAKVCIFVTEEIRIIELERKKYADGGGEDPPKKTPQEPAFDKLLVDKIAAILHIAAPPQKIFS
jgi:hypothetical protein